MTEQEWLGEGYCLIEACIKMARTYSYGGGCGIDIFGLAPKDARINRLCIFYGTVFHGHFKMPLRKSASRKRADVYPF